MLNTVSLHKIVKKGRQVTNRRQTFWSVFRTALFDMDIYAFTPSLMTAQFSTWVSLLISMCVISLFAFCVGYTLYLWAATAFTISQGEMAHDNSTSLVPPMFASGASLLALPKAGVLLLLNNGSSPIDPSVVRIDWEQNTICRGQSRGKHSEKMPADFCSFHSAEDGTLRTNATYCAQWDLAGASMTEYFNTTLNDPCGAFPNQPYYVPRVSGTFWDAEYSYVTASVFVNASLLSDSAFAKQLYKGSVQLYLNYPYTGASSLMKGNWPDGQQVVWSRRVNLLAASNMKWEVTLRLRQVSAASFFWDIPQLEQQALDFAVEFSEISISSSSADPDGYIEVAKVYLKLDDRDMQVTMSPYATVFSLFSDWGGFLSILMALGIPAMLYNQSIFRSTVEVLMDRGDITFDEDLRKKRSEAIATSFAVGVQSKTLEQRVASLASLANSNDLRNAYNGGREHSIISAFGTAGGLEKRDGAGLAQSEPAATAAAAAAGNAGILASPAASQFQPPAGKRGPIPALSSLASISNGSLRSNKVAPILKVRSNGSTREQPALIGVGHEADSREQGSSDTCQLQDTSSENKQQAAIPGTIHSSSGEGGSVAEHPIDSLDNQTRPFHTEAWVVGDERPSHAKGDSQEQKVPVSQGIAGLRTATTVHDYQRSSLTSGDAKGDSSALAGPVAEAVLEDQVQNHNQSLDNGGRQASSTLSSAASGDGSYPAMQPHVNDHTLNNSFQRRLSPAHGMAQSEPGFNKTASQGNGVHGKPPLPPNSSSKTHGVTILDPPAFENRLPSIISAPSQGLIPPIVNQQGVSFAPSASQPGYARSHVSFVSRAGSVDDMSHVSHYEPRAIAATASILVKYHQDIFEDSDEEENDFDDIIRHCTSECHALYHLRQVVKLVQHERSFLTCGTERMTMKDDRIRGKERDSGGRRSARYSKKQAGQLREEGRGSGGVDAALPGRPGNAATVNGWTASQEQQPLDGILPPTSAASQV